MAAIIFDGKAMAFEREKALAARVPRFRGVPRIGSLTFREDPASNLYTQLKKEAAVRTGIEFSVFEESMTESVPLLQQTIQSLCSRPDIHGVMIQKPMKKTFDQLFASKGLRFDAWWSQLVSVLDPAQDLDCLSQTRLDSVYRGDWQLVPATVKAVVSILHYAYQVHDLLNNPIPGFNFNGYNVVVIGRSELVGRPLAAVLEQYAANVKLYGNDLDQEALREADLVISATGQERLITGEMIKQGAVVIDVGAPGPDVDIESVAQKAAFVTPVPYGVGPVTVVSLLENLLDL